MKTALCSSLVASLILCGCSAHERIQNHIPANTGVYEDSEGYAVLSTLLGGASEEIHAPVIRINIVTHVESATGVNSLEDCMKIPEEFREAANDYELKAKRSYVLKNKFSIKTQYDLVGESRIVGSAHKLPPTTDKDISQKISSGAFYLSPVGFDANHSHAIAYKNYICGNLCGWGGYHLLVKNAGRWEEAKDVSGCTWHY
jgi:hypothetical protein